MDLETLYRLEFPWVHATVRRLGVSSGDIEDAVHDIFVKIHEKLEDYDEQRPRRPWLYAFVLRHVVDYRRRAKHRRMEPDVLAAVPIDDSPSPEERTDMAERRGLLELALADVPPHRRDVIVMCKLDDLSTGDVARLLGVSEDTVSSRLRQGLENLQTALRRLQRPGTKQ